MLTTAGRPAPSRARLTRLALAAVLPLLMSAACGYGSERLPDEQPAALSGRKLSADEVRIGYFPNLAHATALVGVQEGLIQSELAGTRLRTSAFTAGPSEIEALNAGSIDIGWIGPSPTVNGFARTQGKALKIIAGSASGGVKLVVNPKKIKTLDDLKGKKIATPQLGNTQDVAFLNWISEKGWNVDPQSGRGDVSVVRTGTKVAPDAYRSGAVDGAWMPEPTASYLVADGATVLLDESSLWPGGSFVTTHVIVSRAFLDAHPDVVEAVLRGSVKTNAWITADPERAKASANAALKRLTGKPLPPGVLDPAWKSIEVTDDPLPATLRTQADHAAKAGLLDEADLTGLYDLGPLNRILRQAGRQPMSAGGHPLPADTRQTTPRR